MPISTQPVTSITCERVLARLSPHSPGTKLALDTSRSRAGVSYTVNESMYHRCHTVTAFRDVYGVGNRMVEPKTHAKRDDSFFRWKRWL